MSDKKKKSKAAPALSDPEQLYEYVKTINPGLWMLLIACVIASVASFLLSIKTHLLNGVHAAAVCDNGIMTVYFGEDRKDSVLPGMDVIINGYYFHVTDVEETDPDELGDYYLYIVNYSEIDHGEQIYQFDFSCRLADGTYSALIVSGSENIMDVILGGTSR